MRFMMIVATALLCPALSLGEEPPFTDGLVAHYGFEEDWGQAINESTSTVSLGAAADCTVTGALRGATGILAGAYLFDGIDDYLDCGDSLSQ